MNPRTWSSVDDYIVERIVDADPVFEAILGANAAAGLPAIDVSAAQGKFLNLLVRMTGARRILEIGTLGGYSTTWMARGLPEGGRLISLEYDPRHAEVATRNLASAGLASVTEVRIGRAAETLPRLQAEGQGPFDFIFIDADKPSNTTYLEWALRLSRPGTVIVLDNVVREGAVIDARSKDANIIGARDAFDLLSRERRLSATALQTVGAKGYDGFAIAIVN